MLKWLQGHPELDNLQRNYYRWLTETGQDEKAGEVKESQGDYQGAVNLYLKAGLPAKAARLAIGQPEISSNSDTISRIAAGLIKGEFYERVSAPTTALVQTEFTHSGIEPPIVDTSAGRSLPPSRPVLPDASSSSPLWTDARRGSLSDACLCLLGFTVCPSPSVCYCAVWLPDAVCARAQLFSCSHLCLCNRWGGEKKQQQTSEWMLVDVGGEQSCQMAFGCSN